MKRCKTCKQEKPISEYYENGISKKGKQYYAPNCKKCFINHQRENANKNKEKIKEYQKTYRLKWLLNNPDYYKERIANDDIYKKTYLGQKKWVAKNRNKMCGYSRKCQNKYPEKYKARKKLQYAVKSGRLKPQPCAKCGAKKTEAHHPDYSKPFEVIWLCNKHHLEEHGKIQRVELIKELQLGVIQH